MKSIEKWRPHLYPKVKKIVAVKFEDGATIQADEAELRGYLKCLDDERENGALRQMGFPSLDTVRVMRRAWISVQASEHASKPRKPVIKAELAASRDQYEKKHDTTRGWPTAACLEFKITGKTLKKRMAE